jgi:hypothetical protein
MNGISLKDSVIVDLLENIKEGNHISGVEWHVSLFDINNNSKFLNPSLLIEVSVRVLLGCVLISFKITCHLTLCTAT